MTLNRIALVDENGRLCTCNRDGSDFRVLTRADRIYQFPAWSPDGRWIAAVGSDRAGSGVYCFGDGENEQQWQLYRSQIGDRESPFYVYWSPDGRYVSFLANHPLGGIAFHIVPCEPNATDRVVALGQPFFWHWGQSSAELLIHAGIGDDEGRFALFNPFDAPDQLQNHALPGYFQTPGFSADGKYIAYATIDVDGESQIVIESRKTGQQVTAPHLGAAALSWSPTQSKLAFMAPNDKSTHFYGPLGMMSPRGEYRQLTTESILAFFWSPDGKKIAYVAPTRRRIGILQPNMRGKNGNGNGNGNGKSGVHPSRLEEAATDKDDIRLDLWVIDLTLSTRQHLSNFSPTRLFVNQFLPFFDQYALSHRVWSPDSDALLMPMMVDGKSQLTVLPIDKSGNTVIAEGFMGFWSLT